MPSTPLPTDTGPDIVVIARRDENQPVYFIQSSGASAYVAQNNTSSGGGGGGGGTAVIVQGVVNVQVDNLANMAAVKDAAENVAQGLLIINELLSSIPSNTPIMWNNVQTTAGAVLTLLAATEWVVTDRTFDNGGVGHRIPTPTAVRATT